MNCQFHRDGTLPSDNWIFVFGSNLRGVHGAGAALEAKNLYGAIDGIGFGFKGMSFAIPTKYTPDHLRCSTYVIRHYVDMFVEWAHDMETKQCFHSGSMYRGIFVTAVGCGLAGYKNHQIAPMFSGLVDNYHVSLPDTWREFL